MVLTANNHIYDSSEAGYFRTLQVLRGSGLEVIGARAAVMEAEWRVCDIQGIRVGFANYCYETTPPGSGSMKTLNGITLSETVAGLVSTYMPEEPDAALARMAGIIATMKAEGAELIVFFMHWGNEYQTLNDSYQAEMAGRLADMGVDVMIGGHPHVLQPVDTVTGTQTGRRALVAYSMGNFISNQRAEMMDLPTSHTEDGLMLKLVISRDALDTVSVSAMEAIPTWVHKYFTPAGKPVYEIVPLSDALADPAGYNLAASWDGQARAAGSLRQTLAILAGGAHRLREAVEWSIRGGSGS
jgi:poly-gamma-glutamate synthesis protein (capsule biosynthesis protein)